MSDKVIWMFLDLGTVNALLLFNKGHLIVVFHFRSHVTKTIQKGDILTFPTHNSHFAFSLHVTEPGLGPLS